MRKKELFPPVGEKMLNCGLGVPHPCKLPVDQAAFCRGSKKGEKLLLVLPSGPVILTGCALGAAWLCWHLSPAAAPKQYGQRESTGRAD